MNWKHILWIIPLTLLLGLIVGGGLGYIFGLYSIEVLDDMTQRLDNCCMKTLSYAQLHNSDCNVLITGKLNQCYYNDSNIEEPIINTSINVVRINNLSELRNSVKERKKR